MAIRTCVACRRRSPKRELIRFGLCKVPGVNEKFLKLETNYLPGRGGYCHKTCIASNGLETKLVDKIKRAEEKNKDSAVEREEEEKFIALGIKKILENALDDLNNKVGKGVSEQKVVIREMIKKVEEVEKTSLNKNKKRKFGFN